MSVQWDRRFVGLAKEVAGWSKDPSSAVGAVIADDKNRIVSLGYNGFARGVADSPWRLQDREAKLKMIIHAEENAILFAPRPLNRCSIYVWPFATCAHCAAMIIQVGICRVVAPAVLPSRWDVDMRLAKEMYQEARVTSVILGDVGVK